MTPQEKQAIESLFQRLAQAATRAGPRDPEAEALVQQRVQLLPGAAYHMAQTLLVQEHALQQAEARLGAGGQGSFLQQDRYSGRPAGGGVGGFLAGAGQMALGIGGGILVADAAMALAGGLFGQHDVPQEQYVDDGSFDQEDDGSGDFDDGGDW